MWPGLFITFEGGEGAGKSSLISKLSHELTQRDYPILSTREPGGTVLGERLRRLLLHMDPALSLSANAELCLFLAARAQHIEEKIRPALEAGAIVLCDRYNDSTVAYQGVGRGLGEQYVRSLCTQVCLGIEPCLTFYLDVLPEEGLRRAQRVTAAEAREDRIEQEELSFHESTRRAFLAMAKSEPERFHIVNAHQRPSEVFSQVCAKVLGALSKG